MENGEYRKQDNEDLAQRERGPRTADLKSETKGFIVAVR